MFSNACSRAKNTTCWQRWSLRSERIRIKNKNKNNNNNNNKHNQNKNNSNNNNKHNMRTRSKTAAAAAAARAPPVLSPKAPTFVPTKRKRKPKKKKSTPWSDRRRQQWARNYYKQRFTPKTPEKPIDMDWAAMVESANKGQQPAQPASQQPSLSPPTTPRTPGGTRWAEPAQVPSYLDETTTPPSESGFFTPAKRRHQDHSPEPPTPTPSTPPTPTSAVLRTPGGTLWAVPAPAPSPSYLDTPTLTQPPLLPRPQRPKNHVRLPIWRRYGRWRHRNHQPEPQYRPTTPSPRLLPPTTSPSLSPLNLPLLPLNLTISPVPLFSDPLNDVLLL